MYGIVLFSRHEVYFACVVSQSVHAMRQMLKRCEGFTVLFVVKFNSTKSVTMRIGKRFHVN